MNGLKVTFLSAFSVAGGKVEHISHMSRDAVSVVAVHLLWTDLFFSFTLTETAQNQLLV